MATPPKKITVEQYLRWSYNFIDNHLYHHASEMAKRAHLPEEIVTRAMCSGKRFRPMLVFLSAQACGGEPKNAIGLATAAEIIHESTLFHDDVIDGDQLRRGDVPFNRAMGNKMAILMGDLGLSYSIDVVRQSAHDLIDVTAATISDIGIGFIREGVDRVFESEHPIIDIITKKTAKLFSLACVYGARSANAPPQWEEGLRQYGTDLGIGFQISDDFCSLLEGLEGKDFTDGITLPLFCLYAQEPSLRDPVTRFGEGELDFGDIRKKLDRDPRGLISAKRKLFNYNNKAVYFARQLPQSPFRDIMEKLPNFVTNAMVREGGSAVVSRWNSIRV